ncbi:MAG: hypothetical protein CMC48_08810 [Flavobacteriaceae bacterium]|nr:hypothetical protein [Flavobacteriaceae bacterium]
MEVKSISSCINCENITSTFDCSKHNIEVDIDKVCSDHTFKKSLTKESNCSNCINFKTQSCPNPNLAAEGMLCFSWA